MSPGCLPERMRCSFSHTEVLHNPLAGLLGSDLRVTFWVESKLEDKRMQPQKKSLQIQNLLNDGGEFSVKRAETLAKEWLTNDPDAVSAWIAMGLVYGIKGQYRKALAHFDSAISLEPSNFVALINASQALLLLGEYENSLEKSKQALSFCYNKAQELKTRHLMGVALNELYRFGESEGIFRITLKDGFMDLDFMFQLIAAGKIEEAVEKIAGFGLMPEAVFIEAIGPGPIPGTFDRLLGPLVESIRTFFKKGYTTEAILQALDKPPSTLEPGTPEYVEWWGGLVQEERWLEDMGEALELLSATPEEREKLLEEKERFGPAMWENLSEEQKIRLSPSQAERFLEIMSRADGPNQALRDEAKRYKERFGDG